MNTFNIIKIITLLVFLILIIESINLTFNYNRIDDIQAASDDYKELGTENTTNNQQYIKTSAIEKEVILVDDSVPPLIETLNNNALLTIEIEKMNLLKTVYQIGSKENNVDKNVSIMKESDMPNIENGNLILGAHSGTGPTAYFNGLIELKEKDKIIIIYDKKSYAYEVAHQYTALKKGRITIRRDPNKKTLTLFTCHPSEKDKNLIVIAYIQKIE
jgi:LPXTG-site transpeptidase (sortase) family protein